MQLTESVGGTVQSAADRIGLARWLICLSVARCYAGIATIKRLSLGAVMAWLLCDGGSALALRMPCGGSRATWALLMAIVPR